MARKPPRRNKKRRKGAAPAGGYRFYGARKKPRAKPAAAPPKRRVKTVLRAADIGGHLVRALMVGAAVGVFIFLVIIAKLTQGLPDTRALLAVSAQPVITVVDAQGQKIGARGLKQGSYVKLSEMPRYLPLAVLAVEDRRFYHHLGIDFTGLARAAFTNVEEGRIVEGGSTITQQLAKMLFLNPERTYKRKIEEALLAFWLESKLTKDQILEIYLNRAYLGAGTYGVEAAAERYFGKSARDLSLTECALIAGLLKAPSKYAPTNSIAESRARTALVLDLMAEANFISPAERAEADNEPARIVPASATPSADYILDWVICELPEFVSDTTHDLTVETSIDLRLQRAAENALDDELDAEGEAHHASEGALVAMTPDGAILAMVGGRSYADSSFNRATDAVRPPGSAFKPFVYLAAIEAGYRPEDAVMDEPIRIGDWQPVNYTRRYIGPTTIETAFAESINSVAARLASEVGIGKVIKVARRFGITSPLQAVPSLALGSQGVGVMELTAAYAPFANGGSAVIPHAVLRITTKDGKTLYERSGAGLGRVADLQAIGLMNRMMTKVVEAGTGRAAAIPGAIVAGKTGTGQDGRDAWFVGFTAHEVAGIWVGNDDFSPMKNVTGGSLPAQIFHAYMTLANAGVPETPLPGTWQALAPMPEMPPTVTEPPGDVMASESAPDASKGFGGLLAAIARTLKGGT